jgi:hypothetical protein
MTSTRLAMQFTTARSCVISKYNRHRFSICGHGGGAQWVQRYVLHSGGRYIERAVAANPGWYLLPDNEFTYPYGLNKAPLPQATLRNAFGRVSRFCSDRTTGAQPASSATTSRPSHKARTATSADTSISSVRPRTRSGSAHDLRGSCAKCRARDVKTKTWHRLRRKY